MFSMRLAAARSLARLAGRATPAGAVAPAACTGLRNSSHGTWSYREPPQAPPKRDLYIASALGGIMWWWILWHCFTQPDHITGEWPIVDPTQWTDEELGVPPDEEGPAPRINYPPKVPHYNSF